MAGESMRRRIAKLESTATRPTAQQYRLAIAEHARSGQLPQELRLRAQVLRVAEFSRLAISDS